MGLSLKKNGKQDEARASFRRALQVPTTSSKGQVQILYLLGRTLESLWRIPEALGANRWLRPEAPQYGDVAKRIESLSMTRMPPRQWLTVGKASVADVAGPPAKREVTSTENVSQLLWNRNESVKFFSNRPRISPSPRPAITSSLLCLFNRTSAPSGVYSC